MTSLKTHVVKHFRTALVLIAVLGGIGFVLTSDPNMSLIPPPTATLLEILDAMRCHPPNPFELLVMHSKVAGSWP